MTVLVDANVLLYARFSDFAQHAASKDWLDEHLNSADAVGLPWVSLAAFARISTNRRAFAVPLTPAEAIDQIDAWCARPSVWLPEPGRRFMGLFQQLVIASGASGNLVPDAWLAALAMEHALTVVSWDVDFARFAGVSWARPSA